MYSMIVSAAEVSSFASSSPEEKGSRIEGEAANTRMRYSSAALRLTRGD